MLMAATATSRICCAIAVDLDDQGTKTYILLFVMQAVSTGEYWHTLVKKSLIIIN